MEVKSKWQDEEFVRKYNANYKKLHKDHLKELDHKNYLKNKGKNVESKRLACRKYYHKVKRTEHYKKRSSLSQKRWRSLNSKKRIKTNMAYIINHPEKYKAVQMAQHKIPLKEFCEICESPDNLQRHHWRYDKPLLVNTLCIDCHAIQHIKNKPIERFI